MEPTVYCTDSLLYGQFIVWTVYCMDSLLYRQFIVPTVYCTDSLLYRQFIVPTVYCTDSLLYRQFIEPTVDQTTVHLIDNLSTLIKASKGDLNAHMQGNNLYISNEFYHQNTKGISNAHFDHIHSGTSANERDGEQ